jgi:hypothetical protein
MTMGLFGFGGKETNLVVVMYEGPSRLRLNGNRKKGKEADAAKKGAAAHDRTVCWIEFSQGGMRVDEGKGPAAAKVGEDEVKRLLKELPLTTACKEMLRELEGGQDRSAKIFAWKDPNATPKPK